MIKELEEINSRREKNLRAFTLIASYLNNCPTLVTKETIEEITNGAKDKEERAFSSFLANVFGESDGEIRMLEREYLSPGVKKLDPCLYTENPFFKNIKIPQIKEGNWDLGYQSYEPYEGFVYRDIECLSDYTEVAQIGFFDEKFSFPTVFENGREWMAIKPNEVETMRESVENARGRVLIYGLGIGYFTYMVSQKDETSHITVVERDPQAIALFKKHILPQFPNKAKIEIVESDAFEYAQSDMKNGRFDFVFTDLWHDVSDGVDLYVKMKKYETLCPNCRFEYWIERSILSSIRWSIFDGIYKNAKEGRQALSLREIEKYLTYEYIKGFVKFI